MPAINKEDSEESKRKREEAEALKAALAKMSEEVSNKEPKKKSSKKSKKEKEEDCDGSCEGCSCGEDDEEEDVGDIGPNGKVHVMTTSYKVIENDKTKEVDLHFSLQSPVEDRFFAYSLTMMDLFRTLEELKDSAPKEVVEEIMTTLHVVKGLSESIKRKLEEDAGFVTPRTPTSKKDEIKKIIKRIKDKLQKEYPEAKINFSEIKDASDIPNVIKSIINEIKGIERDEEEDSKKGRGRKNSSLEKEEPKSKPPSKDLEF